MKFARKDLITSIHIGVHIMDSQEGQDQMHPQTCGYRLLRHNKNDTIFSCAQVVMISSMDGIRYLAY